MTKVGQVEGTLSNCHILFPQWLPPSLLCKCISSPSSPLTLVRSRFCSFSILMACWEPAEAGDTTGAVGASLLRVEEGFPGCGEDEGKG